MSRPHDGHGGHSLSSFFGNHFRIVLRKRSHSFSAKCNQTIKSFETALAERLKQLELIKSPEGFINLRWMQQAMEALCATHKDLRSLIVDLQFPLTKWDEKWMDEYLDETVKLLDICIGFNAEISRLEQVRLLVQYVLHLLDSSQGVPPYDKVFEAFQELKGKAKDAEEENGGATPSLCKTEWYAVTLQGMTRNFSFGKSKSHGKGKVLLRAMYGVKAVTLFVCSIVASALLGCNESALVELRVPDRLLWSASFMSLQHEVNEDLRARFANTPLVLKEREGLDAAVKSVGSILHMSLEGKDKQGSGEADRIKQCVEALRQSAGSLSEGLDGLTKQVNEFFQIVLTGRNAMLDSLRLSEGEDMLFEDEHAKK
uniref:BPS1-like protein n=1 Tax=Araucaria cunninghamii TaxID=56994 RepID=A0A0D6R0Z9_ARACU